MSESDFSALKKLTAAEQRDCDDLIRESLQSEVGLIQQIGEHIVKSGGKRLRPLLVLLSAKAFGYDYNSGNSHILLAAVIELLHTATLLHDDVVDRSELRRGQSTANKIWGDHASILVGDYLYSRAFQLMVKVNQMKVMEIMAQASNQMAEGEVLQLMNCHNPAISEENYMRVIHHKTGTLFAAAAQMGPVLSGQPDDMTASMFHYGSYLGMAFQLVDDALDYSVSSEQMGKNMGDDLSEGKLTLPLIRALIELSAAEPLKAAVLREAVLTGKAENINDLISLIQSTDAISYTYAAAKEQAHKARKYLDKIPASLYRDALMQLIEFALARHY